MHHRCHIAQISENQGCTVNQYLCGAVSRILVPGTLRIRGVLFGKDMEPLYCKQNDDCRQDSDQYGPCHLRHV
jgi:hypothetical protein